MQSDCYKTEKETDCLLQLLSIDRRNATSVVKLRLSTEPRRVTWFGNECSSISGLMSSQNLCRFRRERKVVAGDRIHYCRFNADELVARFGSENFKAAWVSSKNTFGQADFNAELYVEGVRVSVRQMQDDENLTVLTPGGQGEDGRIFREVVGLVELALSLSVSDPETEQRSTFMLFAEPVVTALPDSPTARRVGTMITTVFSDYGRWLAPRGVTARFCKKVEGVEEQKNAVLGAGSERGTPGVVFKGTDGNAVLSLSSAISDEERGERPGTKFAWRKDKTEDESSETEILVDEAIPHDRVDALDRILRVYETGLPYFRANPRMKLRREACIDGAEKLRDFSYATAAYMASHPEHLTPVSPGHGIRVEVRHFLPKKVLVESEEKSTDTYENRVVVGFLKTLYQQVEVERARLNTAVAEATASLSSLSDGTLVGADGITVDSGSSRTLEHYTATDYALVQNAVAHLQRMLTTLESRADRIRILYHHYLEAMPVADIPVTGACPPTPVFLSLPAYRMVYEAIRDWERSEWTRVEGLGLLTFLRQSRLYECWALMGLLEAFGREGFRLVRKFRHIYEAPYRDWEQTDFMNTFRFVRREENQTVEATLFYEPVVRAASGVYDRRGAPLFENGVKFVRTTVFSPEEGEEGARLKTAGPGSPLFYTPDFLLRIRVKEEGGGAKGDVRTFWAVADAKFSPAAHVARERAMTAAFKYLFGMRPIDPKDRVLGLWLFCGKPAVSTGGIAPQSLNGMGEGAGYDVGPDVHVVEMVPEERSDAKVKDSAETPWAKWIRSVLKEV